VRYQTLAKQRLERTADTLRRAQHGRCLGDCEEYFGGQPPCVRRATLDRFDENDPERPDVGLRAVRLAPSAFGRHPMGLSNDVVRFRRFRRQALTVPEISLRSDNQRV
jgi:hypothetical protein